MMASNTPWQLQEILVTALTPVSLPSVCRCFKFDPLKKKKVFYKEAITMLVYFPFKKNDGTVICRSLVIADYVGSLTLILDMEIFYTIWGWITNISFRCIQTVNHNDIENNQKCQPSCWRKLILSKLFIAFIFLFQNIFQLQQDDTTPECFCLSWAIWISFINYIILSTKFFFWELQKTISRCYFNVHHTLRGLS